MDKETLITGYFENTLTENEKELFSELLEQDSDFKAEVEFEKKVKVAITLDERNRLKSKLAAIESGQKSRKNRLQAMRWVAVAASFLILITVGYQMANRRNSNEKLYDHYYQTFPNIELPTVRGVTATNNGKSAAFRAYDSQDYEEASKLFSEIYEKNGDDYALLYQGLSLMELKRFTEAVKIFERYREKPNRAFDTYIKWYLSLCYLRTDAEEKSRSLVRELAAGKNPFQKQASELLHDLE